jgi:hypothetical protein
MEELKIKNDNIKMILIVSVIVAILIDVFHNIKIDAYIKNFIIPLILMLSSYIFLTYKVNVIKNKKAYLFLIPIFLILLSNFIIKIDDINKFLNVFIIPILMSIFLVLLTNKSYEINLQSPKWILKLFPRGLFSNLKFIKNISNKPKGKKTLNVIFGLLIGIPIGLLILSLLISADRYFGAFMNNLVNFLPNIKFSQIFNIFILLFGFIVTFTCFINIIKISNNKDISVKNKKEINTTISSTILIIVNFVFAIFIISEISKLTNNFLHLPIKYTYAEYAREGFFQLLVVTSINFFIIIYHLYIVKAIKNNNFIKNMLILLITFSIILILNSYYRMFLYVDAYSFTTLRLQVLLFLTMELIFFVILIFKSINRLKIKENIAYTTILITFYILNLYLCTNSFIKLISK